jgi:hypothetical protein
MADSNIIIAGVLKPRWFFEFQGIYYCASPHASLLDGLRRTLYNTYQDMYFNTN